MGKNCQYSSCAVDSAFTTKLISFGPPRPPTPAPAPVPPPSGNTWWGRNCYTEYPSGHWYGADNIGDSYGKIGDGACNSMCQSTGGCTCYVLSQDGECWLRKSCQYASCAV